MTRVQYLQSHGVVRTSTRQLPPPGTADLHAAASPHELRILWIDDEVQPGDALLRLVGMEGFRSDVAQSGAEGLSLARVGKYDAIVLDLHLPDMFGLSTLQRLRASGVHTPVLVATAYYPEPEVKADAMRAGAAAFCHKPFLDAEDVAILLRSIITRSTSSVTTARQPSAGWPFGIVAAGPSMQGIVKWIQRVGPTNASALLTGETGTGKDLVARALHRASSRSNELFVPLNCAAIPESLIETELFGHRKGTFTGALSDREGVFEAAHRGTLFLDEIGDLPLAMQGRLLRCLDGGEVRRVGDTKARHVDVRIVAATNRALRDEIRQGRFREDLYYRIAVAHAHLPPLRERLEDVEALVTHWLPSVSERWQSRVTGIAPDVLDVLRSHPWRGNARELHNVLERAVSAALGDLLTERDVAEAVSDAFDPVAQAAVGPSDSEEEVRRTLAALEEHHWNRTNAARSLGIDRSTLWRRLTRGGFERRKDGS